MSGSLTAQQGATFDVKGQAWRLAPLNGDIRGGFEAELSRRAWVKLDTTAAGGMDPMRRERLEVNLLCAINGGAFDWDSEEAERWRYTRDGFAYHVWLRLLKAHPTLPLSEVWPLIEAVGTARMQKLLAQADGWTPAPKAEAAPDPAPA